MSRKLIRIPFISSYDDIRREMRRDLAYRLAFRLDRTSFGRPLYYRINVQVIVTQECPYCCPFCLERQNPMTGYNEFSAQIESLKRIIKEHPNAKLTITGGEPGLYPEHVRNLIETYRNVGNNIGCSINTTGYNPELNGLTRIKLSCNDYVKSDPSLFPGCTLQTVNEKPSIAFIKKFMDENAANSFKIRFLSELKKKDYDIDVWNDLQNDPEINVTMFRIGDFFVNATFGYHGKVGQLALGDMWQQKQNDYQDGYSNIIVHPDGKIGLNWS